MRKEEYPASIMIVDDMPDNLRLLQELLSEQGYRIMAFPSGAQALKAAVRHPPDLILLDIRMPEMDGYEVCRRLKADERLRDIPVLFISALNEVEDKIRAFAQGGVDYVTKPFQGEEVRSRVATHLRLRRLLLDSEQRNQVLIDELPDVVMRLDEQIRFTFVSEKIRLIGSLEPGAYLGKTPRELGLAPSWIEFWEQHVPEVFRTGAPVEQEVDFLDAEGKTVIHDLRLVPERVALGRVTSVLALSRDVTQRKKYEKALILAKRTAENALKAKKDFLANMSHELRTPLSGITGMMLTMQEETADREQRECVDLALKAAARLSQVLGDILDFADLDAGRLEPRPRAFEVTELMSGLEGLFGPQARHKRLILECWVAPSLPRVLVGDEARVRQILVNLAGNALAFTRDGLISLRAEPAGVTDDGRVLVLFTIADTGIGIAEEYLEHVFEPFTQIGESDDQVHSGIGMGLSLSRALAGMLGGSLELSSDPGHGVTARLTLPFQRHAGG